MKMNLNTKTINPDMMAQGGDILKCLQDLGFAVVPTKGTSMWPLLKEGKSLVQVVAVDGRPLNKGDVILYRRKDGTCVLHRIMKVREKDTYLVCGDHQWKLDETVERHRIIAIARGFYKNGRYIDEKIWWYRLYKRCWNGNLKARRCCLAFLRLSGLEKLFMK